MQYFIHFKFYLCLLPLSLFVNLSISLFLFPTVWMQGDTMLLNLHSENPAYTTGNLKQLLRYLPAQPTGKIVVAF